MIGLPVAPGMLLVGAAATGLALSPFLDLPFSPWALVGLILPLLFLRRPVRTTGVALILLGICLGLGVGQLRLGAVGEQSDRGVPDVTQGEYATTQAGGHRSEEAAQPDEGGLLGRIRERALTGVQAGMPAREAALAGGFVLGADDEIDAATKENFRRSGLAHLLAVSGQNVMLLILLGSLPLVVAGVHLRHRVWPLALLVLIYLPLAGGEPSIQRATVMGIVMLVGLRLGRPSQRFFALLLAACLTLAANPRVSGEIGWQLSFAATVAIMVMAPGLRRILLAASWLARLGPSGRLLADGAAVTISATLATAPLMAHHFGSLPLGTVSANLVALPAVAPVMWLGMVAALVGQLPGTPTEAINLVNSVLIAYIAEVAELIASLDGGVAEIPIGPGWLVGLCEVAVIAVGGLLSHRLSQRAQRSDGADGRPGLVAGLVFGAISLAVLVPLAAALAPASWLGTELPPPSGLRIVALDVGQGDAILVQQGDRSLLVDTGPPGAGLSRDLSRYGADRLAALFITHSDRDHIGGLEEVLAELPVERLYFSTPPDGTRNSIPPTSVLVAGERLRFGELAVEVLWPPRGMPPPGPDGPSNPHSLVLLLRWRGFSALLTGDAEAESAHFSAPDVDLLKVAHHGSADAGLPALLQATTPAVALISVGADNRYGHPAPSTLAALAEMGVQAHRTDREGDLVLELDGGD